jgi:hypothetical protein
MKITVSNKNKVGRVTFNKIAQVGSIGLNQVSDVTVTGQAEGDVLVYQSNTSTYVVKSLPKVDGGTY